MDDDTLPTLTIKQAASLLKVHHRTLRRWIDRGVFPEGVQVGSSVRWCKRDIASYLWLSVRGTPRLAAGDDDEGGSTGDRK
jgi:excisionase family DNA binding protein